jgi:hypothetical protein
MKDLACFPYRWKFIALALMAGSVALSFANDAGYEIPWLSHTVHLPDSAPYREGYTLEVWLTGLLASLLILCFCRERTEDEYVRELRLHSWQWAILANYLLLLIATWAFYGFQFLGVIMYNVLTPLIIYLVIFYTRLHVLPRLHRKRLA